MVEHLDSFSDKGIADFGTMQEHDIVLDAEGQRPTTVHDSSQCDISECEIGAALADATSIQVF